MPSASEPPTIDTFHRIDSDVNGAVSLLELVAHLERRGVGRQVAVDLFRTIDVSGDCAISEEEWAAGLVGDETVREGKEG